MAIAVGLKRGHPVSKRTLQKRPSSRKGVVTKRARFTRDLIRDVVGFAPYERRIIELVRNGLDKRALRFAKKRIGTHTRGKRKRDEMNAVIRKQRRAAAAAAAAAHAHDKH
eukprot:TRINITY_DN229_c0_g1_i4.p1 TRINITY_DN229_c0_g1~~TRINITY_DN229_c0_g1_i4.p1  ORF type:complete len:111 (-),score=31.30 TRINITY_DN229_c0_g1_i4:156-488(-)